MAIVASTLAVAESVQDEVDLEHMQSSLMSTVQQTMQPRVVSLWMREENGTEGG